MTIYPKIQISLLREIGLEALGSDRSCGWERLVRRRRYRRIWRAYVTGRQQVLSR